MRIFWQGFKEDGRAKVTRDYQREYDNCFYGVV
jgi:hypothetical protein